MSRLVWDQTGSKFYETGVKNGVLYTKTGKNGTYAPGVAWNGLTAVTESPSGAEATALYADNVKYLNLISNEEFGCTIEAYTYPDEFAQCDGSAVVGNGLILNQQARKMFGFAYRTEVGNDEDGIDKGYKLHLIYEATAAPSEKSYATINDSPEAITFSWEVTTVPINVTGYKATSHIVIDSTKCEDSDKLTALENILYGVTAETFSTTKTYAVGDYVTYSSGTPATVKTYRCKTAITSPGQWDASKWEEVDAGPRLPLPDEVVALMTDED